MRGLIVGLVLLTACGPGAELQAEKDRLELRVADLDKEKARLEKEADSLSAKVRQLQSKLQEANTRVALTKLGIDSGDTLKARVRTTMGAINCELWPEKSPQTVLNFVQLAEGTKDWKDPVAKEKVRRPLYSGTIFHRVMAGFMIQGGDPLGNGRGGPGYQFEDEVDNGLTFDRPGLMAMANSGPNTNGSQFFITDRSKPSHLDGKHTIFGVCEDLDVVEAIATVETARADKPVTDVVIQKVEIIRP